MKIHSLEDVAWCAGFFEADGSTSCTSGHFRLQISQSGDEEPPQLRRFADTFDADLRGPYGPYEGDSARKKPFWSVCESGKSARMILALMEPHMTDGGPKIIKAKEDAA